MRHLPFHIVIPARYGSSRFPGKPLFMIGGKTLIQHVCATACASAATSVVVATDDARIAASARSVGVCVCMTSPHHNSGSDRIAEVVAQFNWPDDACVVNVQGDEPCIPAAVINEVASDLLNISDCSMSTVATKIVSWEPLFDHNVVKVVVDARGFALYFSRAAIPWCRHEFNDLTLPFPVSLNIFRHVGLYAYRAGFLRRFVAWPVAPIELAESLEQLRVLWYGERIHVCLTNEAIGPGVDVPGDILRLEQWLPST